MDNPVAMVSVDSVGNETWYYYYADALGNMRLMTDASGAIVESYTYDPFGRPYVMTSAGADGNWLTEDVSTFSVNAYGNAASVIGNPYMFTGRRWDEFTGLYYYRFRDYDPVLGRFLQTDPAGYIDTMNLYAYCGNNPVNRVDPTGRAWSWAAVGIGAGFGAAGGFVGGVVHESVGMLKGNEFSWGDVGGASLAGASGGAAVGAVAGALTGDPSALAVGGSLTAGGATWVAGGAASGAVSGAMQERGASDAYQPLDIPMTKVAPGIWRDDRPTVTKSE